MAMQVVTTAATIALVQALFVILITLPSFSQQVSLPKPDGGGGRGYVMNMIHRDSPRSPFYNPNATRADLWKSSRHRSILRHNYIQSALTGAKSLESPISSLVEGEYITRLIIGTPPFETWATIDTGSDLIWVFCLPCKNCTDKSDSIFDPSKSFTYEKVECGTQRCNDFENTDECSPDGKCAYNVAYLDGSYSRGILSYDNLTMATLDDEVVSFPYTVFGCSREAGGTVEYGVGMVGLTRSPYSLMGQLGFEMHWKFSYCLGPRTTKDVEGGTLVIGDGAVLSGNATKMSAISRKDGVSYVILLNDITVGSVKLGITSSETNFPQSSTEIGRSGMIIDSGTTYTYLETRAFETFLEMLKVEIKLKPVSYPDLQLCYQGRSEDLTEANIPVVTFNFLDLDVVLQPTNTFVQVDQQTICLAMEPTKDFAILGNIAQQNMSVGYDLANQKVYIAPTGCTSFW